MLLSVSANNRRISVLEITLVTFEINLQMVFLHVSSEVAVTPDLFTTIKTLQQSITVPVRKFDHDGRLFWVGMLSDVLCPVVFIIENQVAFFTHFGEILNIFLQFLHFKTSVKGF